MSYYKFAIVASLAFVTACSSGTDDDDEGASGGTISTTIMGVVVDEANTPVPGATLTAHGATTTSQADGTFAFPPQKVPAERCVVIAKKRGMLMAAQSANPIAGGATMLQVTLITPEEHKVDTTGGELTLSTGAKVSFKPNAFKAAGASFSGEVTVLARHLDPADENFASLFPGGPAAVRADGTESTLISVGVITVELETGEGATVTLDSATPAGLDYPTPTGMEATLGSGASQLASIPLWHFDEAKGLWVEEGAATLVDGRYVGEVRHFTPWNLDLPAERATVKGRLLCGGKPMSGVRLSGGQFTGLTGADGRFNFRVPANFSVPLKAADLLSDAVLGTIPALPSGAEHDFGDLSLPSCPAVITGKLVGCSGEGTIGSVFVATPAGVRGGTAGTDGRFSVLVPPLIEVSVTALIGGAPTAPKKVLTPASNAPPLDIGELTSCVGKLSCETNDHVLPGGILSMRNPVYSPDGKYIVLQEMETSSCRVFETATWNELAPFTECYSATFSPDGATLYVRGVEAYAWPARTLKWSVPEAADDLYVLHDGTGVVLTCFGSCEDPEENRWSYALFDAATGAFVRRLSPPQSQGTRILGTFEDSLIVESELVPGEAVQIDLWSTAADAIVKSHTFGPFSATDRLSMIPSHDGSILIHQSSDDGDGSLTGGSISYRFFDTADGTMLAGPSTWDHALMVALGPSPALAPSKKWFAMSYINGTDIIVNVVAFPSLEPMGFLTYPKDWSAALYDFAFSADGETLAIKLSSTGKGDNEDDEMIHIWDLACVDAALAAE